MVIKLPCIELKAPISKGQVKKLKLRDIVFLSGKVYSMRDAATAKALKQKIPVDLLYGAIYHCGPIVKKMGGATQLIAAGPTTSARMNHMMPKFLRKYNVSAIIGKGGMSKETARAMKGKAIYLAFPGGCGALAASSLGVEKVFWRELGMAGSVYELQAERFGPLVVAIDAKGKSLYE